MWTSCGVSNQRTLPWTFPLLEDDHNLARTLLRSYLKPDPRQVKGANGAISQSTSDELLSVLPKNIDFSISFGVPKAQTSFDDLKALTLP